MRGKRGKTSQPKLVVQVGPLKPVGQAHEYDVAREVQVPPFWQGLLEQ